MFAKFKINQLFYNSSSLFSYHQIIISINILSIWRYSLHSYKLHTFKPYIIQYAWDAESCVEYVADYHSSRRGHANDSKHSDCLY